MPIPDLGFDDFVNNWLQQFAAETNSNPNPIVGSMIRALAESDAQQATVLYLIATYVIDFARATTSTGADLDSWMAQFNFVRLPANAATGSVTFSTPVVLTQQALVPVGTVIQTADGSVEYTVIADSTQVGFNPSLNAYVVPAGETSVNVTVQALTSGITSNVQANQLNQIQTTIFGVSQVVNSTPILNGTAAESDTAFRARFIGYLASLSKGTKDALTFALQNVSANIKISLISGYKAVGNPPTSFITFPGNIIALVDDGSGNPSDAFLLACSNAVAGTAAFGIQYQVVRFAKVVPPITVNIRSTNQTAAEENIQNAIVAYVNSLPGGGTIDASYIYWLAWNTDPTVTNVQIQSVTVNGLQADYVMQPYQEALIAASNVTVGGF